MFSPTHPPTPGPCPYHRPGQDCEKREDCPIARYVPAAKCETLLEKENLKVTTLVGYEVGYEEGAKAERERVVDEPHINQYLERIRKSSIALKDEKLKTIISVSLSIAADHYESLRSKERE